MAGTGGGGSGLPGPGSGGSGDIGKQIPGLGDAVGGGGEGVEKDPAGGAGTGPGGAGGGASGLGAGGTSAAPKSGSEDSLKGVGKGAAAVAAVPAAGIAAQLMIISMFLTWLKGMLAAMVAMAANLMSLIMTAIMTAVNAVVGGVMAVGAGIAAAVGGAISATTGAVAAVGMSLLALVGIGAGAAAAGGNTTAQRDGMPSDCRPAAEATIREIDEDAENDTNRNMEKNAEEVYSILSGWGMPDENIAGVLGNFQGESQIDPTAVETIRGEDYKRRKQKKDAERNGFRAEDIIGDQYEREGIRTNIQLVGIGLGQWTNSRNTLLTDYADEVGENWYDLELQMQFLISGDEDRYIQVVDGLINDSSPSVDGSTKTWMEEWEVLGLDVLPQRQEWAAYWFMKMDDWEADVDLADSILEQAEANLGDANENRRDAVVAQCRTVSAGGGGGVVELGETVDCDGVDGGQLHPDACAMHEELQEEFGGFFLSAGGQRPESGSNHGNGQAIDYMLTANKAEPSPEVKDSAEEVINYVIAHSERLNITGILWTYEKWNPTMDPIGEWSEVAGPANTVFGDHTLDHVDHIHISVGPDRFM